LEPRYPPGEKAVYVSEILDQCSGMAARTARVYRRLAERLQGEEERVRLWRELALEEETHADILRRELQSFQEQDQAGSFLPEYAERLSQLDAQLCQLERRAETAGTLDEALAVAVALEQADLEDLYDDLVLQGEPAFRLMSERIEAALAAKPQRVAAAGLAKPRRP
jgi:rubrerythrin